MYILYIITIILKIINLLLFINKTNTGFQQLYTNIFNDYLYNN